MYAIVPHPLVMYNMAEKGRVACSKDNIAVALQAHHERRLCDRGFYDRVYEPTISRSPENVVRVARYRRIFSFEICRSVSLYVGRVRESTDAKLDERIPQIHHT